jgi:hypothetical protein
MEWRRIGQDFRTGCSTKARYPRFIASWSASWIYAKRLTGDAETACGDHEPIFAEAEHAGRRIE